LIQSQAKVYWLSPKADNLDFVATSVSVQKSANKDQVLQTALEQLLSQTPNAPATTAIPTGTQLLSLKVNSQGVYLNLSAAFTQGGGSESMAGRLGQVLYTASSLDPNMPVWISVEGKPLETLGGEGLMIDQPITRQWFKENFEM
jgi:spore germination protein GerM